jgi:DNA helicase-2/ATP-dependent DNA helicase PcrA
MQSYQISYESELNESQYEAVIHRDGPILVIAGAGTGKTRTLTYRVARLIEDGVRPESILLLTFTRKASEEMLTRAANLLDFRCSQVNGGTFHSFANRILRRFAPRIQFNPGFSILDTADSQTVINNIREAWELNSRGRQFPNKATIAAIISKSVNKCKSVSDIVSSEYQHFEHEILTLEKFRLAYQQKKREQQAMDYDDLLVYLRDLLKFNADVCKNLSNRFQYIMVDEYQDTNIIQAEIIRYLAGSHQNVMVVGDDAQSIYAFRGAHYKNIMNFPNQFEGTTIVKLEENYRSRQPILTMTNAIIEQASESFRKSLFTKKKKGVQPRMIVLPDEPSQSRFIIEMIKKSSKKNKIKLQDMAVLFRSAYLSNHLEIQLKNNGIDFVKYGGLKFLDKLHVKDFLALLRIMIYPYDEQSWRRVFLMMESIGSKTSQKLTQHIIDQQMGFQGLFTYKTRAKYAAQLETLKNMLESVEQETDLIFIAQAVVNYYEPILERTVDNAPRRMAELKSITEMLDKFDSLEQFLVEMALDPPNSSVDDEAVLDQSDQTHLTLSTIHSAKGLEWRMVFIIWALDGRFPSYQSLANPEALEEELRLMYVASTRAKEKLFITSPINVYDRRLNDFLDQPSTFISSLPESLVDWHYLDN